METCNIGRNIQGIPDFSLSPDSYQIQWAIMRKQCSIRVGKMLGHFLNGAKCFIFNPGKKKFYATLRISFTQDWRTCSSMNGIPNSQSRIKARTINHKGWTLQINSAWPVANSFTGSCVKSIFLMTVKVEASLESFYLWEQNNWRNNGSA